MSMDNILWSHPENVDSKGTILLVHGTTAFNLDGNIPNVSSEEYPPAQKYFYKKLSDKLVSKGWSTLRYTRPGVYEEKIDWDEYNKVDLPTILNQLERLVDLMPNDKPRIVFCWSGGSIHVPQLKLEKINGVVILGGITTKRYHIPIQSIKDFTQYTQIVSEVMAVEEMSYEDAKKVQRPNNPDGQFVKFWQEDQLKENWNYIKRYPELPLLILHGTEDEEVPIEQARLWKQLLPMHKITLIEKEGGNHMYGKKDECGASEIVEEIINWLNKIL